MTFAYLADSTVANAGGEYLTRGLRATDTVAALSYGAYTVTVMSGRLVGDGLVQRFGGVRVARVGAVVAVLGFVVVIAAWHPYVALFGFLVLGAGLSVMVPQSFAAAGRLEVGPWGDDLEPDGEAKDKVGQLGDVFSGLRTWFQRDHVSEVRWQEWAIIRRKLTARTAGTKRRTRTFPSGLP